MAWWLFCFTRLNNDASCLCRRKHTQATAAFLSRGKSLLTPPKSQLQVGCVLINSLLTQREKARSDLQRHTIRWPRLNGMEGKKRTGTKAHQRVKEAAGIVSICIEQQSRQDCWHSHSSQTKRVLSVTQYWIHQQRCSLTTRTPAAGRRRNIHVSASHFFYRLFSESLICLFFSSALHLYKQDLKYLLASL